MLPVAIFVSGSGSNLQAILDAVASDPDFGVKPVLVLSDRADAPALDRAVAAGVETQVVEWSAHPDRSSFTTEVTEAAVGAGAELIVLAGFMRILGREAIERFRHRIVNTHPALLPAFRGAHAIEEALAAGVKVTGVTIHYVDEEVDHGPIIAQEAVVVDENDTTSDLQRRIQTVEHRLFPDVIKAIADGRIRVERDRVKWE